MTYHHSSFIAYDYHCQFWEEDGQLEAPILKYYVKRRNKKRHELCLYHTLLEKTPCYLAPTAYGA